VFHASLLTPYIKTDAHGPNFSQSPPDLIKGEAEYKVETIRNHQRFGKNKRLQYLLKWKGYPESDNIWEPVKQLHAPDLVKQHHKCHPLNKIKSALLARLKSHLPPWLPPLSPTAPSLLTTQTPSPTSQISPLTISCTSFSPPSSDNSPLPFMYPLPRGATHHCNRWWTPTHILMHSTSSNPMPIHTTHMPMLSRAASSATNTDTVNTTTHTRSLWTTPIPSSTPTMLSSLPTGPPTHDTLAFPSPCPTILLKHPKCYRP
jgi:hypothetical protein